VPSFTRAAWAASPWWLRPTIRTNPSYPGRRCVAYFDLEFRPAPCCVDVSAGDSTSDSHLELFPSVPSVP